MVLQICTQALPFRGTGRELTSKFNNDLTKVNNGLFHEHNLLASYTQLPRKRASLDLVIMDQDPFEGKYQSMIRFLLRVFRVANTAGCASQLAVLVHQLNQPQSAPPRHRVAISATRSQACHHLQLWMASIKAALKKMMECWAQGWCGYFLLSHQETMIMINRARIAACTSYIRAKVPWQTICLGTWPQGNRYLLKVMAIYQDQYASTQIPYLHFIGSNLTQVWFRAHVCRFRFLT